MTGSRQTSAGSCVQVSGFGLVHLTATERGHQHTLKVVLGDLTLSFDLHSDSHPHVVGAAGRAPLRTDPECPAGRALRLLTCCQRGLAAAECDGERPARRVLLADAERAAAVATAGFPTSSSRP